MTPAALEQRIRAVIGLAPRPGWQAQMAEAVTALAQEHACTDAETWTQLIEDDALLVELASHLTIDESYFGRHPEQYPVIVEHVRARLAALRPGERVTLWSLGCARGEEPLSVAIMLREALGDAALARVSIVAIDINRRVVAVAKSGRFRPWSLRGVPDWMLARYFAAGQDGEVLIDPSLAVAVRFEQGEVEERLETIASASIDVALFRNVGIYFEPEKIARIYTALGRVLRSDGLLVTAPADPSPDRHVFARAPGDVVGAFVLRPEVEDVRASGSPSGAIAVTRPVARNARRAHQTVRAVAEVHAASVARSSVVPDHRAQGREHLQGARVGEAIAEFRRALFIDGGDHVARFWYVAALQRAGHDDKARAQMEELARRLASFPADHLLADGETRASRLLDAVSLMRASMR